MIVSFSFIFLLQISFSEEVPMCPSIPNDYLALIDDNNDFTDQKLYACENLFNKQVRLTNCILSIHSCTFSSINLGLNLNENNFGIILFTINNENKIDQTKIVEFKACQFYKCEGGCIHISCSEVSRQFTIEDCIFDKCYATLGYSLIHFQAAKGNIEKCIFYDNNAIDYGSIILYKPPEYDGNDVKLKIANNSLKILSTGNIVYSFIYLSRDGCKLDIINNQISVFEGYENIAKCIIGASTQIKDLTNINIKNNCLKPFFESKIFDGNSNLLPKDGFNDCAPSDCLLNYTQYPDYIYKCGNIFNDDSKVSFEHNLVGIFYSTFNKMIPKEDQLGGAIYILTNSITQSDIQVPYQIYYTDFYQCCADFGGAIHIVSSENSRRFDIHGCRLNSCGKGWYPTSTDEYACGGSIYINTKSANIKISDCNFELCQTDFGGAIYYCSEAPSSLPSSKIIFENNKDDNDYVLQIVNCTFWKNSVWANGAAILLSVTNSDLLKPIEIIDCLFDENDGDHWDMGTSGEKPENGGAIYYVFNSQSNPSLAKEEFSFIFRVAYCNFLHNRASYYGGVMYIEITNYEPPKQFEIKNCTFIDNQAGSTINDNNKNNGDGGCIYIYRSASSPGSKSDNNDPYINIVNCKFQDNRANVNGGSIFFTIQNNEASSPIEINGCSFRDCSSKKGSVDIVSSNENVFLHIVKCTFQKVASVYFNSVYGLIEDCDFKNINGVRPISYDCNSNSQNNVKSFTIENCRFLQTNDVDSLIFFVPKDSSLFYFNNNIINISTNNLNTRIFGCSSDAELKGNWNFANNDNYPYDEKYINDDNSNRITFPPSCTNGFLCGVEPTTMSEEESSIESSSSEESSIDSSSDETSVESSIEPETVLPTLDLVPGTNCERNKRCFFNGTDLPPSFIDFSFSEFVNLYCQDDGGAICVINYGVVCNSASFINCSSIAGGGGAIYISVKREMSDPISFQNITVKECKAIYGGGIYIYCSPNSVIFKLISSSFIENEAQKKPAQSNEIFYGGGAIFMTISNSNITNCKFIKNSAQGIKIYNNFDSKKSLLSNENVFINNCLFEIDQHSTSSVYYIRGDGYQIPIEINDCIFTGNLSKGAHHIDGLLLSKKNDVSKLQIRFCRFSSNKTSALNKKSKELDLLFSSFDENLQEFEYKEMKKTQPNSTQGFHLINMSSLFILAVVFTAIILLIVIYSQLMKKQNDMNESLSLA